MIGTCGRDSMITRREIRDNDRKISSGPGNLAKAMGFQLIDNGEDLLGERIWLTEGSKNVLEIEERRRVGIDYAEEDAELPWRFTLKGSEYISRPDYK